MYLKEAKGTKCCYLMGFALSAIIYIVIGSLHGNRSVNAETINKEYLHLKGEALKAYDSCRIPNYIPDATEAKMIELVLNYEESCKDKELECAQKGTDWSGAWRFNAFIMITQGMNFILLAVGAYWFYPRCIGTFCNLCLGCCHLGAWIACLAARYSPPGELCAVNISPNQLENGGTWSDDWTYKKDAELLGALGIIQSILFCVQCCGCCWPLFCLPIAGGDYVDNRKEEKA